GLNQLKGNVLAAASSVDVKQESGSIRLDAKMGTIRTLHGFLLGLLLVAALIILASSLKPTSGSFDSQQNQLEFWTFSFGLIGLIGLGSIIASRRVYQKAFDNLLTNLVMAGGTDRTSGSVDSSTVSDIVASQAGSSLVGQVRPSEKPFWQRIHEAYPTRVYWSLLAVWSLFMIPLADSLETIPLNGLFWVALTIVALGLLLPICLAVLAWFQQMKSGSWEMTILKRPPIRLLMIPAAIPFLFASAFWGYRQLTCGIVQFDVDDPDFTVSVGSPEKKWSASYSADFYALRLSPGKYYWSVKHGATSIKQGQLDLTPRSRHTISARSPYPLGQAAMASLPGRWKLQGWQPFGKPAAMPHQAPSQVDYIDVTNDSIQVHSQFVREAWSFFIFDGLRPGDKRTDIDPEVVTFSFQFP
ncbi:MAG: hypothetical protein WCH39_29785, partial [Schlesneria sp.]